MPSWRGMQNKGRTVFRVPTSAFRVLAKVGPDPARYRRWRKEARMSRPLIPAAPPIQRPSDIDYAPKFG